MEEEMNSNKETAKTLEDMKVNVKIKLSALWISVMFLYVYADVRGFYETGVLQGIMAGEVDGIKTTQGVLVGNAIMMAIQSVMVVLSLTLKYPAIRWITIIAAVILFLFNLVGLPGYSGTYHKFLIIVSLVFNGLTVLYVWKWVA